MLWVVLNKLGKEKSRIKAESFCGKTPLAAAINRSLLYSFRHSFRLNWGSRNGDKMSLLLNNKELRTMETISQKLFGNCEDRSIKRLLEMNAVGLVDALRYNDPEFITYAEKIQMPRSRRKYAFGISLRRLERISPS